jgi:uncharacterized membrane protein YbhN (UPF0104 family)
MKAFIKILKVALPIGLAVYLMYITFKDPQDRQDLFDAIKRANYFWVLISMLCAWASHMLRARRWKYLLEPMGFQTRFWSAYHAVMSGYLINMAIPRAGEVSRAGLFSGVEKTPFDKTFGSVAAERVVDLIILLSITAITVISQYDIIWNAMRIQWESRPLGDGLGLHWKALIGLGIILLGVLIARRLGLFGKVKAFVLGLMEGLTSILRTPYKLQFFRDTILIWTLYMIMFGVMYQCLEETSGLGMGAILAGFVFGSFAVILTPGGTGAYHLAVALALSYYGIQQGTGQALGLIIWGSQTLLVIVLGFLSLLLMPIYNREYPGHTALTPAEGIGA